MSINVGHSANHGAASPTKVKVNVDLKAAAKGKNESFFKRYMRTCERLLEANFALIIVRGVMYCLMMRSDNLKFIQTMRSWMGVIDILLFLFTAIALGKFFAALHCVYEEVEGVGKDAKQILSEVKSISKKLDEPQQAKGN